MARPLKRLTRIAVVVGGLELALSCSVFGVDSPSNGNLNFPNEPDASILETQFPPFPQDPSAASNVAVLTHYESQLEAYREGILELYNESVQTYSDQVDTFSKQLEVRHARGAINEADYRMCRDREDSALQACSKTGKLMMPYTSHMVRYKTEMKWTIQQLYVLNS
jgi:hypothetical protein